MNADRYPPRQPHDWMRSIEEKGWELVAEVPWGGYYLEMRPKAAGVILVRPACKPRNVSLALFFGVEMRREAVQWAKGKAKADVKKVPRRRKTNGPI